jgi:hypothetical protein
MNADEIIRGFDANTRTWIALRERLATRTDALVNQANMQRSERTLIFWIIITPIVVYGGVAVRSDAAF